MFGLGNVLIPSSPRGPDDQIKDKQRSVWGGQTQKADIFGIFIQNHCCKSRRKSVKKLSKTNITSHGGFYLHAEICTGLETGGPAQTHQHFAYFYSRKYN